MIPPLNRRDNEDDDPVVIEDDDYSDDDGNNPDFDGDDAIRPNEGDALHPNEGDALRPDEGDDTALDSPIANRTRSRRGAPSIWPIPTMMKQGSKLRMKQSKARRNARPSGRYFNLDRANFSSHEGAENYGRRRL